MAGARLSEILHPLRGPGGEALACDVARFGAEDADAVLWVNSATHGVEGYCGSDLYDLDNDRWKKQVVERTDELTGKAIRSLAL